MPRNTSGRLKIARGCNPVEEAGAVLLLLRCAPIVRPDPPNIYRLATRGHATPLTPPAAAAPGDRQRRYTRDVSRSTIEIEFRPAACLAFLYDFISLQPRINDSSFLVFQGKSVRLRNFNIRRKVRETSRESRFSIFSDPSRSVATFLRVQRTSSRFPYQNHICEIHEEDSRITIIVIEEWGETAAI